MSEHKKKKGYTCIFYAVAKGNTTGIFNNWLKCNAEVNKVSGVNYKGFWSLEEAEQFLRRAGVQCTWVDFNQSYLDSICRDSSSAESVSRSRSPLSDRGVSRMECNNRMSSTSLDAENNQCKNCITLASRVRSLSSEIESLREKIEFNNMPSSKPMDESVGKPRNCHQRYRHPF